MSSPPRSDIHAGNTRVLPWPYQPRAQLPVSSGPFLTRIERGSSTLGELAGGRWLQSDLEQRLGTAVKFSGIALCVMGLSALVGGFIPETAVLVGVALLDAILFAALMPLLRRDDRSIPQPTRRPGRRTLQADLLLQTLVHLLDLPGVLPRLGFDSPSRPTWSLCVESGHVGRVWVDVLDSGSTITFSLAIWPEAPASVESVQAALDEALGRGGLDALGLRGRGLKIEAKALPIWGFGPRLMLLMVDVTLIPDVASRARALAFGAPSPGGEHLQLQPAPAELRSDVAVAFGRLVRLLTLASLPGLEAARLRSTAIQGGAALRVRARHDEALPSAAPSGDRTWPLLDDTVINVAPIEVRAIFLPAASTPGSAVMAGVILLLIAAIPAIYAALTDEIGLYATLWAMSILGAGIAMFLAERPLWTRRPFLRPRGVPTAPRSLRLEGRRLTLDEVSIDLDAPFTLLLTRGAQAENAKIDEYGGRVAATLTELGLRVVQQSAAGPQRLSLRVAGLALDEQAERLDVLDLDAPRLEAAALADDLWPVLRDAAAAHGRAPDLELTRADAAPSAQTT